MMYKTLLALCILLPLALSSGALADKKESSSNTTAPAASLAYTVDKVYKCKGLGDVQLGEMGGKKVVCFQPKDGKQTAWSIKAAGMNVVSSSTAANTLNGCQTVEVDHEIKDGKKFVKTWTNAKVIGYLDAGHDKFPGGIKFTATDSKKVCKLGKFKHDKKESWVDTNNKDHKGKAPK